MRGKLLSPCLLLLLLSACSASVKEIAAWGTETKIAEEYNALAGTATKLAEPQPEPTETGTPTMTTTGTQTPTRTSTSLPSSTATPPEGSAYVPDLVGMAYKEATELLDELGLPWYYVSVVLNDVPAWQIVEQTPRAGSLLDVENMSVKLVVSFDSLSKPRPQGRAGTFFGTDCLGLNIKGTCYAGAAFWCEDKKLFYQDCSYCNGICGFNDDDLAVCYCP